MEYYDYREWIIWPEEDIREYAREIAADQSLGSEQARYLEGRMAERAGYWPKVRPRIGPFKVPHERELAMRSNGEDDDAVFAQNRRINSPYVSSKFNREIQWQAVGRGLTRRQVPRIVRQSPDHQRDMRRYRKQRGQRPFTSLNMQMRSRADDAMWAGNCYPISMTEWLIFEGADAPFEGLRWYSDELLGAYYNARELAARGNVEAAMWHAFRAGALDAELGMRIAYGELFEKFQAVSTAQRDAGKSRKRVPDEMRIDAYWRYRSEGNKRVEAGRLAAKELGLSESSIRNAFPDGVYPEDAHRPE